MASSTNNKDIVEVYELLSDDEEQTKKDACVDCLKCRMKRTNDFFYDLCSSDEEDLGSDEEDINQSKQFIKNKSLVPDENKTGITLCDEQILKPEKDVQTEITLYINDSGEVFECSTEDELQIVANGGEVSETMILLETSINEEDTKSCVDENINIQSSEELEANHYRISLPENKIDLSDKENSSLSSKLLNKTIDENILFTGNEFQISEVIPTDDITNISENKEELKPENSFKELNSNRELMNVKSRPESKTSDEIDKIETKFDSSIKTTNITEDVNQSIEAEFVSDIDISHNTLEVIDLEAPEYSKVIGVENSKEPIFQGENISKSDIFNEETVEIEVNTNENIPSYINFKDQLDNGFGNTNDINILNSENFSTNNIATVSQNSEELNKADAFNELNLDRKLIKVENQTEGIKVSKSTGQCISDENINTDSLEIIDLDSFESSEIIDLENEEEIKSQEKYDTKISIVDEDTIELAKKSNENILEIELNNDFQTLNDTATLNQISNFSTDAFNGKTEELSSDQNKNENSLEIINFNTSKCSEIILLEKEEETISPETSTLKTNMSNEKTLNDIVLNSVDNKENSESESVNEIVNVKTIQISEIISKNDIGNISEKKEELNQKNLFDRSNLNRKLVSVLNPIENKIEDEKDEIITEEKKVNDVENKLHKVVLQEERSNLKDESTEKELILDDGIEIFPEVTDLNALEYSEIMDLENGKEISQEEYVLKTNETNQDIIESSDNSINIDHRSDSCLNIIAEKDMNETKEEGVSKKNPEIQYPDKNTLESLGSNISSIKITTLEQDDGKQTNDLKGLNTPETPSYEIQEHNSNELNDFGLVDILEKENVVMEERFRSTNEDIDNKYSEIILNNDNDINDDIIVNNPEDLLEEMDVTEIDNSNGSKVTKNIVNVVSENMETNFQTSKNTNILDISKSSELLEVCNIGITKELNTIPNILEAEIDASMIASSNEYMLNAKSDINIPEFENVKQSCIFDIINKDGKPNTPEEKVLNENCQDSKEIKLMENNQNEVVEDREITVLIDNSLQLHISKTLILPNEENLEVSQDHSSIRTSTNFLGTELEDKITDGSNEFLLGNEDVTNSNFEIVEECCIPDFATEEGIEHIQENELHKMKPMQTENCNISNESKLSENNLNEMTELGEMNVEISKSLAPLEVENIEISIDDNKISTVSTSLYTDIDTNIVDISSKSKHEKPNSPEILDFSNEELIENIQKNELNKMEPIQTENGKISKESQLSENNLNEMSELKKINVDISNSLESLEVENIKISVDDNTISTISTSLYTDIDTNIIDITCRSIMEKPSSNEIPDSPNKEQTKNIQTNKLKKLESMQTENCSISKESENNLTEMLKLEEINVDISNSSESSEVENIRISDDFNKISTVSTSLCTNTDAKMVNISSNSKYETQNSPEKSSRNIANEDLEKNIVVCQAEEVESMKSENSKTKPTDIANEESSINISAKLFKMLESKRTENYNDSAESKLSDNNLIKILEIKNVTNNSLEINILNSLESSEVEDFRISVDLNTICTTNLKDISNKSKDEKQDMKSPDVKNFKEKCILNSAKEDMEKNILEDETEEIESMQSENGISFEISEDISESLKTSKVENITIVQDLNTISDVHIKMVDNSNEPDLHKFIKTLDTTTNNKLDFEYVLIDNSSSDEINQDAVETIHISSREITDQTDSKPKETHLPNYELIEPIDELSDDEVTIVSSCKSTAENDLGSENSTNSLCTPRKSVNLQIIDDIHANLISEDVEKDQTKNILKNLLNFEGIDEQLLAGSTNLESTKIKNSNDQQEDKLSTLVTKNNILEVQKMNETNLLYGYESKPESSLVKNPSETIKSTDIDENPGAVIINEIALHVNNLESPADFIAENSNFKLETVHELSGESKKTSTSCKIVSHLFDRLVANNSSDDTDTEDKVFVNKKAGKKTTRKKHKENQKSQRVSNIKQFFNTYSVEKIRKAIKNYKKLYKLARSKRFDRKIKNRVVCKFRRKRWQKRRKAKPKKEVKIDDVRDKIRQQLDLLRNTKKVSTPLVKIPDRSAIHVDELYKSICSSKPNTSKVFPKQTNLEKSPTPEPDVKKRFFDSDFLIKPTKTKDITKIKGWRKKIFTENLKPDIIDSAPPVFESKSAEPILVNKSAFESEALDNFLINAKLNISYEVPKLIAEEAISDVTHRDVKIAEQKVTVVKTGRKVDRKCKAKTLAEKRKMIEKDRQKELLHEMEINETSLLKQLKRNEKKLNKNERFEEIRNSLRNQTIPITRECWQIASKNKHFIKFDNEKIRVCGSFVNSIIFASENKSQFKPGPLSKKQKLCNVNADVKIKALPNIFLEVNTKIGARLNPKIEPYVFQSFNQHISEQWAEFACSLIHPKTEAQSKFPLSYQYNKEKLLMIHVKPDLIDSKSNINESQPNTHSKLDVIETKSVKIESDDVIVKNIIDKLLDYVTTPVLDNSTIKYCPDCPEFIETEVSTTTKKRTTTELELRRLNVQVVDQPEDCTKPECALGCVCLNTRLKPVKHCKRIDCIFDCTCKSYKSSQPSSLTQIVLNEGRVPRKRLPPLKYSQYFLSTEKVQPELVLTKVPVLENMIELKNVLVWCMVHRLYKCFCNGHALEDSLAPPKSKKVALEDEKSDEYITYSSRRTVGNPFALSNICARIRGVPNFYLSRNKSQYFKIRNEKIREKEGSNFNGSVTTIDLEVANEHEEIIGKSPHLEPESISQDIHEESLNDGTSPIDFRETVPKASGSKLSSYKSRKVTSQFDQNVSDSLENDVEFQPPKYHVIDKLAVRSRPVRQKKLSTKYSSHQFVAERFNFIEPKLTKAQIALPNEDIPLSERVETTPIVIPDEDVPLIERIKTKIANVVPEDNIPLSERVNSKTSKVMPDNNVALRELVKSKRKVGRPAKKRALIKENYSFVSKKFKSSEPEVTPSLKRFVSKEPEDIPSDEPPKKLKKSKILEPFDAKDDNAVTANPKLGPLIISESWSLPDLVIPMPHIQNHFRQMVFKTTTSKHIFRLMSWEALTRNFHQRNLYIWFNEKAAKARLVATKTKAERPSPDYIDVKRINVENSTVDLPEIVRGLITDKLSGKTIESKNTFGIFVFTGKNWEIRGTILKKPNDDPIVRENPPNTIQLIPPEESPHRTPLNDIEPAELSIQPGDYGRDLPTSLRLSIPVGPTDSKWFMLILENDFSVCQVSNSKVRIRYAELKQTCQIAMQVQRTVRFLIPRENEDVGERFGGYAVPGLLDRIFFGPYEINDDSHGIITYSYANGKLMDTRIVEQLYGRDTQQSNKGIWYYTKGVAVDPLSEAIVDLTDESNECESPENEKMPVLEKTSDMPTLEKIDQVPKSYLKSMPTLKPIYGNTEGLKKRKRKSKEVPLEDPDIEIIPPEEKLMWLISEPANLGYLELKKKGESIIFTSPLHGNQMEFKEMGQVIEWIDKMLRKTVIFVPKTFEIRMFLVDNREAIQGRKPLSHAELRGHHMIGDKGLVDLTGKSSEELVELGLTKNQILNLASLQERRQVHQLIHKLGETFLQPEFVRTTSQNSILNMACPEIQRLQKSNICLKREKRDLEAKRNQLKIRLNELENDDVILIEDPLDTSTEDPAFVIKDVVSLSHPQVAPLKVTNRETFVTPVSKMMSVEALLRQRQSTFAHSSSDEIIELD